MIKILVIDDDRMNCELIQSVFTRHGYQVLSATSGIEGLTLFRELAPRVTILDLRMPEMDGLTVLKEIPCVRSPCAGNHPGRRRDRGAGESSAGIACHRLYPKGPVARCAGRMCQPSGTASG